jgi:hypothetical protein
MDEKITQSILGVVNIFLSNLFYFNHRSCNYAITRMFC